MDSHRCSPTYSHRYSPPCSDCYSTNERTNELTKTVVTLSNHVTLADAHASRTAFICACDPNMGFCPPTCVVAWAARASEQAPSPVPVRDPVHTPEECF